MLRRLAKTLFGVAIAVVLSVTTANADLVLYLDFGPTAASSGNWNHVDGGSSTINNLVDWNTGLPTAVDLHRSITTAPVNYAGWNTSTPGNWVPDDTVADGVEFTDQVEYRLGPIDKSLQFSIDLVSYGPSVPDGITRASVQGVKADHDVNGPVGFDWESDEPPANGNWMTWEVVQAGGGVGPLDPGDIIIRVFGSTGGLLVPDQTGSLNAIRITQSVPEPSAFLCVSFICTLAGAASYRRRVLGNSLTSKKLLRVAKIE